MKETQEGCLSRPIRIKSELFLKVQIFKQTGKNTFLTVCSPQYPFSVLGAAQSVKEVSQICELFGIIGEKENRRGKKNGTVAAG